MRQFSFTARDHSGAATSGMLKAESVEEMARTLREQGKYLVAVRGVEGEGECAEGTFSREREEAGGIRISRAEVIQLAMQLAVMLETGVTLSEALDCIASQEDKATLKDLVEDLSAQVQGGVDFSAALSRHPRSFPRLFVALVRASEKTGMMSKLLMRGTAYLRDEQETMRRVKGAMVYPAIMFGFAVLTTVLLLVFVLPRFAGIYASNEAALPLPTRVLMGLSEGMIENWAVLILLTGVVVVGGWLYTSSAGGRRVVDYLSLHMPLIGPIARKAHLSRGLRMVGTMAGAGVNMMECIQTAHDLSGNSYYRDLWKGVSEQVEVGKQLSEPLFASTLVPRSVAQMIHSGEKSGKLAAVMEQIATYSEQELKEKIAELTRYIEPAMIVVMGVIIGGVTLALLLPIFTISRVMTVQ